MIFWLWCIIWNNGLDLDTVTPLTRQKKIPDKVRLFKLTLFNCMSSFVGRSEVCRKGKNQAIVICNFVTIFLVVNRLPYPDNNPCLPAWIWVNRLGTSTSCLFPLFYIHYISIYLFLYFYKCVILSSHLAQFSTNLTFYVLFAFHTKDQNWPGWKPLKTKIADDIDLKAMIIFARAGFLFFAWACEWAIGARGLGRRIRQDTHP